MFYGAQLLPIISAPTTEGSLWLQEAIDGTALYELDAEDYFEAVHEDGKVIVRNNVEIIYNIGNYRIRYMTHTYASQTTWIMDVRTRFRQGEVRLPVGSVSMEIPVL